MTVERAVTESPRGASLRVLLVHNRYRSDTPSGENRVVEEEAEQLRQLGHDVVEFTRDSDDLTASASRRALAAVGPVYSVPGVHQFRRVLREREPDIVHVHNVYPLISPWVVRTSHHAGIPVVQTVHNYRHLCVRGTHFRDGAPCQDCLGRRLGWPGVLHSCYRDSRAQSTAMVVGQASHRETWRSVERLLPVSSFVARQLVRGGFDAARITVRHQGIEDAGPPVAGGAGVVFVGRLDVEKGVPDLLQAWQRLDDAGSTLTIIGDGPLRAAVERVAAGLSSVRVLGKLTPDAVRAEVRRSAIVVVPSRWFEGLPRVVVEAFMLGKPVLGADLGSLSDLITPDVGWLAPPGAEGLAATLRRAVASQDHMDMGRAARRRYEEAFTVGKSMDTLVSIYRDVLAQAALSRQGGTR